MNLKIFILLNFLLVNSITSAQCPNLDSLWKRLIFLRDAYQIPNNKKLNELLTYEKEIRPCTSGKDSTTVLLNQRIGMAYFGLSDYLKAIKYLKESIRIANIKRANSRYNIWNYFYLSAAYD